MSAKTEPETNYELMETVEALAMAQGRLEDAAPDLLSALQRLLELCENGEGADMYGQEQARAAIQKATEK